MRRTPRLLTSIIATTALVAGLTVGWADGVGADEPEPGYGPTFQLNPSGGTDGTDGLRITFGGSQLSVQRFIGPNGPDYPNNEVYRPGTNPGDSRAYNVFSHIALAVGDPVNGGTAFVTPVFVYEYGGTWYADIKAAPNVNVRPFTIVAEASASQIVEVMTGVVDGRTYSVTATVSYTAPADRMRIEYSVSVPAGNTAPVRLYHLIDSFLGGSDEGPGFFLDPASCGSGNSGAVVGVTRPDLGKVQGFQYVSGAMWTGYMSGYYKDVVFGSNVKTDPDSEYTGPNFGPGWMNDLNDQIITDPTNDNGFGINWNFGSSPGVYSSVAKLVYAFDSIDPCADPEAVAVINPDATLVPDPVIDADVIDDPIDPEKDPLVVPKPTG